MKWEPPEFVAAKLVAELAGWDVTEGYNCHAYNRYYVVTSMPDGEMYKVEPTPAGAARLVQMVQRKNAAAA